MSTNNTDSLLVSIEREHQRLRQRIRWLTFGLVLTLVLLVLGEAFRWLRSSREASTAAPGELRATRLVITDKEGRVRAELGLAPDAQEPQLALYHPDGQRWAALAIAPPPGAPETYREAGLFLQDQAGKTRVALGASEQDTGLVLYNPEGTPSLSLYAEPDSQGLVISGGNAPRIRLRYNQHDDGQLSELVFQDERKRTQAALSGGPAGGSLNFYRPDGESTFQAP
jgi:hypothetical protein